jgi:hypothetical protein
VSRAQKAGVIAVLAAFLCVLFWAPRCGHWAESHLVVTNFVVATNIVTVLTTNRYMETNPAARLVALVTDYGADPSGAADSAGAFRRAFSAVAHSGGGVVVPPGKYRLDSWDPNGYGGGPKQDWEHVVVTGSSNNDYVLRGVGQPLLFSTTLNTNACAGSQATESHFFRFHSVRSLRVSGITAWWQHSASPPSRTQFVDVGLHQVWGGPAGIITIDDCSFRDFGLAIHINAAEAVKIRDCVWSYDRGLAEAATNTEAGPCASPAVGIKAEAAVRSIELSGCLWNGSAAGSYLTNSPDTRRPMDGFYVGRAARTYIHDNDIRNIGVEGVNLEWVAEGLALVCRNSFTSTNVPGLDQGTAYNGVRVGGVNTLVTDNVMLNVMGGINATPDYPVSVSGLTVANNQITLWAQTNYEVVNYAAAYGILLDRYSEAQVVNNTVVLPGRRSRNTRPDFFLTAGVRAANGGNIRIADNYIVSKMPSIAATTNTSDVWALYLANTTNAFVGGNSVWGTDVGLCLDNVLTNQGCLVGSQQLSTIATPYAVGHQAWTKGYAGRPGYGFVPTTPR